MKHVLLSVLRNKPKSLKLRVLMSNKTIHAKELSHALGFGFDYVSRYLTGYRKITPRIERDIHRVSGIDLNIDKLDEKAIERISKIVAKLSDYELSLLGAAFKANDVVRFQEIQAKNGAMK